MKFDHVLADLFIWVVVALIGLWINSFHWSWLPPWTCGFVTGIVCSVAQQIHREEHKRWKDRQ